MSGDKYGPIGEGQLGEGGLAARYNAGKVDWSLLPMHLLEGEVRVWMYGAKKYSSWNWTKGFPWTSVYNSLMRHLLAWRRGEDLDPESGFPHLDHISCNIRMLQLFAETHPELDNRKDGGHQCVAT